MNSDKSEDQKLPDGWVLCKSKSNPGKNYYFNKKSGKSSWTQPQESEKSNKSSSKNEHIKNLERKKKEELAKKGAKRKSDTNEGNASNKKFKQDSNDATPNTSKREITPRKTKVDELPKFTSTPRKTTPSKSSNRRTDTQVKKPYVKNLANTRLSHLRTVLNTEVKDEEPKVNETPKRTDRKSPSSSLNDSRTTQSPSSDSLQSIPSPSQFFAANKIISSMKAQLPEEFCGKEKQKDTFADIEKEICSQTTEYPFSKHPATPPQFSEATKLVSAIKSKLAYRGSTSKETKTFSSAKERMENLRNSLSFEDNELSSNSNSFLSTSINNSKNSEAMDVEDFREEKLKSPPIRKDNNGGDNVVLVVDTNIFIHDLDFIKNVLNSHIKGYSEQPTLLVPWRVINELDRLKDNNNGNGSLCKRAKAAMDYLYKSLPENSRIKGQSLRDANSHIYPCEVADDEILNCSLQQAERGRNVILVTNDKNLSNKATINNVKRIDVNELKRLVENKPQPISDPDLLASVKHYQHTLYHLLANILENEMRAKYNNLWQRVLFKPPPWSLLDVLQCLLKHWIAVFNEVFPRIEQLITDLKNSLASIEMKDPNTLTQSEVVNFKELCLDVAKKCRIIPEYMELAKMTVERLLREEKEDTQTETQDVQREVVEAFEGMWTVLSSYSAKLSSALGIEHSIEDKLPGTESLYVLTGKWTQFNGHVIDLISAINSILNEEGASTEASLSTLLRVFRATVGVSSHVTRDSVASFCATCRNMLQEAYNKFSQLAELLNLCRSRFSTDMG